MDYLDRVPDWTDEEFDLSTREPIDADAINAEAAEILEWLEDYAF